VDATVQDEHGVIWDPQPIVVGLGGQMGQNGAIEKADALDNADNDPECFPVLPFIKDSKPHFNACTQCEGPTPIWAGTDHTAYFKNSWPDKYGCAKSLTYNGQLAYPSDFRVGNGGSEVRGILPPSKGERSSQKVFPEYDSRLYGTTSTALTRIGMHRVFLRTHDSVRTWVIGCTMWKQVYCVVVNSTGALRRQCASAKRASLAYVDSCFDDPRLNQGRTTDFDYLDSSTHGSSTCNSWANDMNRINGPNIEAVVHVANATGHVPEGSSGEDFVKRLNRRGVNPCSFHGMA